MDHAGTPTPTDVVTDTPVDSELADSFLAYAMSVIISRALPDARDGLKPVHRRILYTMAESGLKPEGGYVKSARVVGNTMGRFHPHGDSAIYAAMVRLAQDFQMSVPLVDGHGNFGTLVDSAAASRYTECKMTPAAVALTSGITEDTVDMADNYDGRLKEPTVLPAAFPNLLVNGTTGIAVGMATNILPHNLTDVTRAAIAVLKDPDVTPADLADIVIGPDLPSGGTLLTPDGARDSYLTGRGAVTIGSVWNVETTKQGKSTITFTELPYQVAAEKVLERINDLIRDGRLPEVARAMDLTDRKNGLRLVVELRRNVNVDKVVAYLNKHTPLRSTYHLHHLALINNIPITANIKELLTSFTDHRMSVVRRRSEFRRAKAQARLHIVDGLLKALQDIDKIVAVIRKADSTTAAREQLIAAFDFSDIQATSVLEMPLRRLTSLETKTLTDEAKELRATIAELDAILTNETKLRSVVVDELTQTAAAYGHPRRTTVGTLTADPSFDEADTTEDSGTPELVVSVIDTNGSLRRTLAANFPAKPGKRDSCAVALTCPGNTIIGWVTSGGHLIYSKPSTLPEPGSDAVAVDSVIDLDVNERVVAGFDMSATKQLVMLTARGGVKRFDMTAAPKRSAAIMKTGDGDPIIAVFAVDPQHDARLSVAASNSNVWTCLIDKIPVKGAAAGGVAGMKLADDATIIAAGIATDPQVETMLVTTIADNGDVHTSALNEYPTAGRGSGGVRGHKLRAAATTLVTGFYHSPADSVWIPGSRSVTEFVPVVTGRGKSGRAHPVSDPFIVWPTVP